MILCPELNPCHVPVTALPSYAYTAGTLHEYDAFRCCDEHNVHCRRYLYNTTSNELALVAPDVSQGEYGILLLFCTSIAVSVKEVSESFVGPLRLIQPCLFPAFAISPRGNLRVWDCPSALKYLSC